MAAVKLGSKPVGSIIELREDGKLVEFYVAKHNYESRLNGSGRTLLVRKSCHSSRPWNTVTILANPYSESYIDDWFNNTYKKLLDSTILAVISTTKIYCAKTVTSTNTVAVSRPVFALSGTELGLSTADDGTPQDTMVVEGSALPISSILKTTPNQWTRSTSTNGSDCAWCLTSNGKLYGANKGHRYGSRPAFTLPTSLYISDDGTVTANAAPGTPPSISVPNNINHDY